MYNSSDHSLFNNSGSNHVSNHSGERPMKVLLKASSLHRNDIKSVLPKVLVLYTGGTIGMLPTKQGVYAPELKLMEKKVRTYPQLHDVEYAKEHSSELEEQNFLVLPSTGDSFRVIYHIYEYSALLDSSNMTMDDWIRIAMDIKENYEAYNGFVILHGTDTMAYTASALSFMLENLGKTVVITGSQIPLYEPRSDGRDNLMNSLVIAGNYCIPEVTILFNNKLFRGNRTSKISTSCLDAFNSPNHPPLAVMGTTIQVDWRNVFRPSSIEKFSVHGELNRNVGLLRLFPSITVEVVRAFLSPPVEGVVLQTYGAGNGPSQRKDLFDEFKRATRRGVIIVNCTQCTTGQVDPSYETGQAFIETGVVPGSDMTPEAALTKLSYVLSKTEWTTQTKRAMVKANLRGELTVHKDIKLDDLDIISAVAKTLRLSSSEFVGIILKSPIYTYVLCEALIKQAYGLEGKGKKIRRCPVKMWCDCITEDLRRLKMTDEIARDKGEDNKRYKQHTSGTWDVIADIEVVEVDDLRDALYPAILCSIVSEGNLEKLEIMRQFGAHLSACDYDYRTPLHIATSGGDIKVVEYLLHHGASVHMRDRDHRTPLMNAIDNDHHEVIKLIVKAGGYLNLPATAVGEMLCSAARQDNVKRLESLHLAGVDLSEADGTQRTALHYAVEMDFKETVQFLISHGAGNKECDIYGHTPTDLAVTLKRKHLLDILTKDSEKCDN